jgi:DNA topoisomerase-1
VLKISDKYKRIKFNEITQSAITEAIDKVLSGENKGEIDQDLVNAQITRRLLDRIIGFRLSKLMRRKMSGYPAKPSAGRVQSIALKLTVEKEKEIDAFIPFHYFKVYAKLSEEMSLSYIDPSKSENKE